METAFAKEFLRTTIKQSYYYQSIANKALEQIDEKLLFVVPNENSNSLAIIMKHLAGNMLSRWTDFRTTDGEKEWRNRDTEFEQNDHSKLQLMNFWNKGWVCYLSAIESIQPEELLNTLKIRGESHTYIDAIHRQLAHYPYHVGQIVFLCKLLKDGEWESLSIAKDKSREFNDGKFKNSQ
jgi:Protein of unknown function (DUF1572)